MRCPQVPRSELTFPVHTLYTSKVHPFALYTFFPYLSQARAKKNSHSQYSIYHTGLKKLGQMQQRVWGILRHNSRRFFLPTMNPRLIQQCAGFVGKDGGGGFSCSLINIANLFTMNSQIQQKKSIPRRPALQRNLD